MFSHSKAGADCTADFADGTWELRSRVWPAKLVFDFHDLEGSLMGRVTRMIHNLDINV